jgi:hypothetical protein
VVPSVKRNASCRVTFEKVGYHKVQGATRMFLSRRADRYSEQSEAPLCSKCRTEMKVVTSIAPTMNDPGLIAYECAGRVDCPAIDGIIEESKGRGRRSGG